MPNLFTLIGDAWRFYQKQPVLNSVILWLLFIPGALINVLITVLAWMPEERLDLALLIIGLICMLSIVLVWGTACVLLVARRTVKTSVGRTRTSFDSLRHEASTLILPLLLTGILQACYVILWAILLVVPGIIYQIRTSFYHVVIVTEGKSYRAALKRSRNVVKGQTWPMLGYLIGLSLCLYLPVSILSMSGWAYAVVVDARLTILFDVIDAGLNGIATTLFLIALVSLYGTFQKRAKKIS